LPPLSSGGAQVTKPSLRFHIPLIEPDMQIARIRLSDKTHTFAHERSFAIHRPTAQSCVTPAHIESAFR